MRIVIVGGGAAGATAAQFARKENRKAVIDIYEESPYPEYSRCGLPYVLSGEIPSFESLVEYSEEWFQRNKINLHLSTEVVDIYASVKKAAIESSQGRKEIEYDSIIFTTGAFPSIPHIKGILHENRLRRGAFIFRGMDDAKALEEWCRVQSRNILIIGAGLVGLECAEALHKLGHKITVVEYLESILPVMVDPDMVERLSFAMAEAEIAILTSTMVESITGEDSLEGAKVISRKDETSTKLECDTVLLATGQKPNSRLAHSAGCELGKQGHIKVNARCETNISGIFAAGDCAQYRDLITRKDLQAGLGTLAVKMGEVAGKNAAGGDSTLPPGFLNSRVTRLFGLQIAAVGPLSRTLLDEKKKFVQSRVKGSTLPSYYPGGKELTVKLIASKDDGRLLGCQIIGEEGSGHRVNVVGGLVSAGKTAYDLSMLETTYAPPVAPCVDVLTTAAQAIILKLEKAKKSG